MTQLTRDIINVIQAAMLDVLRDSPQSLCPRDLFARMGISRAQGMEQMAGLRDANLVTETTPVCMRTKSPALWTISMAGRRALSDYGRKLEQDAIRATAAAPPTHSFWGTTYTPPGNPYYRNDGNSHIRSAGVPC